MFRFRDKMKDGAQAVMKPSPSLAALQALLTGDDGEISVLGQSLSHTLGFPTSPRLRPLYDLIASISAEKGYNIQLVVNIIRQLNRQKILSQRACSFTTGQYPRAIW